jgi:hypothetical protein
VLAPTKPINQDGFLKLVERAKLQGYLALLLDTEKWPKGFSLFFAHLMEGPDRTQSPMLATLTLSAKDALSDFVIDPLVCTKRISHLEGLLMDEVRRFDTVVGGSSVFFEELHRPMLLVAKKTAISPQDLPLVGKLGMARVYQKFLEPPKKDENKKDEFPYRSRQTLLNLLRKILTTDSSWADPAC